MDATCCAYSLPRLGGRQGAWYWRLRSRPSDAAERDRVQPFGAGEKAKKAAYGSELASPGRGSDPGRGAIGEEATKIGRCEPSQRGEIGLLAQMSPQEAQEVG